MKKEMLSIEIKKQVGFSLVEVILASSIFLLSTTVLVGAYLYGLESTALAGNRSRAVLLAEEGLEATRNIRDENFSNLSEGVHGLSLLNNQWNLSGSSDTTGIFVRTLTIINIDSVRKIVVSKVTWQQNMQRVGLISATTYYTNWQNSTPIPRSCNDYALEQGYQAGACKQNVQQCNINNETHLPGGDVYCTNQPRLNTCCSLP